MKDEVRDVFDSVSTEYDLLRRKLIPCYDDFYNITVSLLDTDNDSPRVLDIGAGTGLLSSYVLKRLPNAKITLIDFSEGMLEMAKLRFKDRTGVRLVRADYSQFIPEERYNIIVSALSIHHLPDKEKQQLYHRCFQLLEDGGILVNADQVAADTEVLDSLYKREWRRFVEGNQLSKDEITACYERMKLDKETKMHLQLEWLKQAGFTDVDCAYKYYNFAVMTGRKNLAGLWQAGQ
jgi:tRNA (cmo5U34)-methyltransferase